MRPDLILVLALASLVAVQSGLPPDRDRTEEAHRQVNRGVALLERYDYAQAAAAFRRALALDASLAAARHDLAVALYYDGQLSEAAEAASVAVASIGASPRVHYVRGLIARAAGDSDAAGLAFEQALTLDADDAGARIHLGQVRAGQRRYPEAVALLERARQLEPFNATAAYALATSLTRAGRNEAARAVMAEFQRLRDDPAAITYSSAYSQEGRHGEALAATGLDADLVDRARPEVRFIESTVVVGPADPSGAPRALHVGDRLDDQDGEAGSVLARVATRLPGGVTLADLDGDGDLDLVTPSRQGVTLLRNDAGRLAPLAQIETPGSVALDTLVGDVDNDGRPDLFVLGYPQHRLVRQAAVGGFAGASVTTVGAPALARSASLADVDHDGDIDVVVAGLATPTWAPAAARGTFPSAFTPGSLLLLRNNGEGNLEDVTARSGVGRPAFGVAILPSDVDARRDLDMMTVRYDAPPALLVNRRDGTFEDLPGPAWPSGAYTTAAAGDVNKDRVTDLFLGRAGAPGVFLLSDGPGRFASKDAPPASADARAAQLLDYDNDGLLDLLLLTAQGPRLLRSLGSEWQDVTEGLFTSAADMIVDPITSVASGDIDGDGDVDLVMRRASGTVRPWTNEGGNRRPSVRVRLAARVSNRSALGAVVELRAGSLYQRVEVTATAPQSSPADIGFGLGQRGRADVVRVLWPAGIVQAEPDVPLPTAGSSPFIVQELDRKPSSCPFLFTWNGERFEFVSDVLGGGELGAWASPTSRSVPDPDEYVRIAPEQLVPRDGTYELRITSELEEAVFLDRAELVVVDHPGGSEIFPNEGLRSPSVRTGFDLFTTRAPRPPRTAIDSHGHDVLARLAVVDGQAADDFVPTSIQGVVEPHTLTIAWPAPAAASQRTLLLLTGWTEYAFSSDLVAADQAGLSARPPALQMRDAQGVWETVVPEVGLPVGHPQTVVVDLTRLLAERRGASAAEAEVRLLSSMRVHWDQIVVDTSTPSPYRLTRLDASAATLRWRGFSAPAAASLDRPYAVDYSRTSALAPWKTLPGLYTRFGVVRPLLAAADDQFVITAPGDEIALRFPATSLPSLPGGWVRSFLLHVDGFSKEMNLRSSSPDRLDPLPFHGMTDYPYPPSERAPLDDTQRRYRARYNTRRIGGPIPALAGALLETPHGAR